MAENFTPLNIDHKQPASRDTDMQQPNKRTLEIVRQFARCYQALPSFPTRLNALLLN